MRCVGGLPIDELAQRLEFPVGYGRQDIWIGRPLPSEDLKALPLQQRKQVIVDAINGLGPGTAAEAPSPPDPTLAARVDAWQAATGASVENAVLFAALEATTPQSEGAARLIEGAKQGVLRLGNQAADRWLGELARWLYGPRGPQRDVEEQAFEGDSHP